MNQSINSISLSVNGTAHRAANSSADNTVSFSIFAQSTNPGYFNECDKNVWICGELRFREDYRS
jgi:hypothetical protein